MSFLRHEEIYRPIKFSTGAARARTARGLIGSMSFRLAIPWWVALPQGPPPLHQPVRIVKRTEVDVQSKSSER
jgi:hypothetical protein